MIATASTRSTFRLWAIRRLNVERDRLGRRPLAVYERDGAEMHELLDELAAWRAYRSVAEISVEESRLFVETYR